MFENVQNRTPTSYIGIHILSIKFVENKLNLLIPHVQHRLVAVNMVATAVTKILHTYRFTD